MDRSFLSFSGIFRARNKRISSRLTRESGTRRTRAHGTSFVNDVPGETQRRAAIGNSMRVGVARGRGSPAANALSVTITRLTPFITHA